MKCPDCGVDAGGVKIDHIDTCPIGRGIEEITTDDRLWFEANPEATERRREPHWAEGMELQLKGSVPGVKGEWGGEVVVTLLGPGVRTRRFDELFYVPSPEGIERWSQLMAESPINVADDGTVTPAGPPPFEELPFEVARQVDAIIAEDFWGEIVWKGRHMAVVSDTFLQNAAAKAGEDYEEWASRAWSVQRGDGRKAYIWRAPGRKGTYGIGKPKWGPTS